MICPHCGEDTEEGYLPAPLHVALCYLFTPAPFVLDEVLGAIAKVRKKGS